MSNLTYILLVDDRKENLLALEALLEAPGLEIVTASSGNEALGLMLEHDFAVVILDVQMPGMDGFEVAELMRKSERTRYLPIIFVTAISKGENYVFKGYETGAVDYLFKPLNPVILKSKVNIFLELARKKKEVEKSKIQIEKQNERLKELSITDGLTGLYNHRYFQEILTREFALVKRNRSDLTCFMIDLDYFKEVNDSYGHTFGDFVLRHFAQLLKGAVRKTDILARYGGEEFALLLPHTSLNGSLVLAEKFRGKAEKYVYENDGYSRRVTVSIGVACYSTNHPAAVADLVNFADQALYRAKAAGRNQVRIYNEEALIESGALASSPSHHLLDLKSQFKKIQEQTAALAISSFETLVRSRNPDHDRLFGEEYLGRHQRMVEIFDLMAERLGLPPALRQTAAQADRLHHLLEILLEDDTVFTKPPLDKNDAEQQKHADYPIMLEELTRIFDILAEERSLLRYDHDYRHGAGFPGEQRGARVPLASRLFSLVNMFVSLTSTWDNKPALPLDQVNDRLVKHSTSQWDQLLIGHLLDLVKEKQILPVPGETIRRKKEKEKKKK
jgi:diguanylate cyclase (GGDEF)-like protein